MKSKTWFFVLIYFLVVSSAFSQQRSEIFSLQTKGLMFFPADEGWTKNKTSPGIGISAHYNFNKTVGLYLDINAIFLSNERSEYFLSSNTTKSTKTSGNISTGLKINMINQPKQYSLFFKGGFSSLPKGIEPGASINLGTGYKYIIKNNLFIYGEADFYLPFLVGAETAGFYLEQTEPMIGIGVGFYLK